MTRSRAAQCRWAWLLMLVGATNAVACRQNDAAPRAEPAPASGEPGLAARTAPTARRTEPWAARPEVAALVEKLATFDDVGGESVGIALEPSSQWTTYLALARVATVDEMAALVKHEHKVVRAFAEVYFTRQVPERAMVLEPLLHDAAVVTWDAGCVRQVRSTIARDVVENACSDWNSPEGARYELVRKAALDRQLAPDVRGFAVACVAKRGGAGLLDAARDLAEVGEAAPWAIGALGAIGEDADFARVVRALDEESTRVAALNALVRFPRPEAVAALEKVLDHAATKDWLRGIAGESYAAQPGASPERVEALGWERWKGLAHRVDAKTVARVEAHVRENDDAPVLLVLLDHQPPEARAKIAARFMAGDRPKSKLAAAWVLARDGATDDPETLRTALKFTGHDTTLPRRFHIIERLVELDDVATASSAEWALTTESVSVRIQGARWLARLGARGSIEKLEALAATDRSPSRPEVERALAVLRAP